MEIFFCISADEGYFCAFGRLTPAGIYIYLFVYLPTLSTILVQLDV